MHFLSIGLILLYSALFAITTGAEIPEIKKDCSICHETRKDKIPLALRKPLSELCIDCHPGRRSPAEHVIDVVPSMEVAGLPLTDGRISCVTCHDPHDGTFGTMLRARPEILCGMCHRY